jgi:hypothetical protein
MYINRSKYAIAQVSNSTHVARKNSTANNDGRTGIPSIHNLYIRRLKCVHVSNILCSFYRKIKMARTKAPPKSRSSLSSSSRRNASSIEPSQNSGYSSYSNGNRPKCKLSKTFPSIRPAGCKVKTGHGATSRSTASISSMSHSHNSSGSYRSSHSNGSGPGPGHSNRSFSRLTHVSDSANHSSQATRSSKGSRGSRAVSGSIIERRLDNERLHRNTDNLINYYAKKKKQKKSTSGASYPQSSQNSRMS